jgi:hypothetical protein
MNGSNEQRGPRRKSVVPGDLAQRFLEWQRLRKQVQDLEQGATQNPSELEGTTNEKPRK